MKTRKVHFIKSKRAYMTHCYFDREYFHVPLKVTTNPHSVTCKMCKNYMEIKIREAKANIKLYGGK